MNTTQQQFTELAAQGYNNVPIIREIFSDLETPLSIYLKLANTSYTYLFESVKGGEKWGRYCFIGLPCQTVIQVKDKILTVHKNNELQEKITTDDPLAWIEKFQTQFRTANLPNLPLFNGGLVGYFGYDTVRYIEPHLANNKLPDKLNIPDILLMLSNEFIMFDTLSNKIYLVIYANPQQFNAWENAQQYINTLIKKLHSTSIAESWLNPKMQSSAEKKFISNFTQPEYEEKVKRAVQYMIDGDIMQVTVSQRFSKPYAGEPFNFYRALRSVNPSPYLFYLNLKDFYIAGSSPEILVRLENDTITLRPLAGTRCRGKTLEEDLALEKELLADPKELAEHLMLIDLGRNDVGRVSQTGSVQVTEKMGIERYSHVMHIVSNVVGKIIPNQSAIDVLRATFPAGTLTGTPKVRAMEIINELETIKRNIYAGAVGYLSWNGNMDLAIALRTAVIKDHRIHIQAGAGLVVDSIPHKEYEETVNKALALLKAAEIAEAGLKYS